MLLNLKTNKPQLYLPHMYRFQEGNVAQSIWYRMKCYWKHIKEYNGNTLGTILKNKKSYLLGHFP